MLAAAVSNVSFNPFFIQGDKGALFCLFTDMPVESIKEAWIYVPPFAEEMNRCRAMAAMQARSLASYGIATLILDYYGTGDSEGELAEASWEVWKKDILAAVSWLRDKQIMNIKLWGVRLGAILAIELIEEKSVQDVDAVLWQPVVDGKSMLTQFLRVKIAAAMERGDEKLTTKGMRESFAQGENIEVAGYCVPGSLTVAIDSKHLKNYSSLTNIRIDWFERMNEATNDITLPSKNIIKAWQSQGVNVVQHVFSGPTFWQSHERELSIDLLDLTTKLHA